MADNGLISLGDVLDQALEGVELRSEPAELSEKDKAKLERQQKRFEEQQAAAQKRKAEMEKLMAERRAKRDAEVKSSRTHRDNKPVSYQDARRGMDANRTSFEEQQAAREEEYHMWVALADRLNDPSHCCPDDQLTVAPEHMVRDNDNNKKFLFCNGLPVRPTFIMPNKDDKSISYRCWKRVNDDVVIVEIGSRIPKVFDKTKKEKVIDPNGTPKGYFCVKYYDADEDTFKISLFMYERFEHEFAGILDKLDKFFEQIPTDSKKKFHDLRSIISTKVPGVFGKTGARKEVHDVLSKFLRAGGVAANHSVQHLKKGERVAFNPEASYVLVNTSHHRSGVIVPAQCVEDKINGYVREADGVITGSLAGYMALIEFLGNKFTIVYGAK